MSEKQKKVREGGNAIFSYSRFGTMNQCPKQYKYQYIDKVRGKQNIYSLIGGVIHDALEDIHENDKDKVELKNAITQGMIEAEVNGYKFPSEKIENSYMANMKHYINNFERKYDKIINEMEILYNFKDVLGLDEDFWIIGYIDVIVPAKDGKIAIVDWKTSSMFAGKKLKEAGRQLLLYAYVVEQLSDRKVDYVAWELLKYIQVCFKQKNGKVKKMTRERRSWVSEIKDRLESELSNLGKSDLEIEMLIDEAIENNNIDNIPEEIKNQYWTEDCVLEYDYNEKNVNEMLAWLKSSREKIMNEREFKAVKIDSGNSFFCQHLCGFSDICEEFKEYKRNRKE